MARIRTIKPDLFRHEGLFELEQDSGMPIRFAFAGLFTVCDREGRFEWKPNKIKLDVLPWDDIDFSSVLDALASREFILKYRSSQDPKTRFFGSIPTFRIHQVINNKEAPSKLPDPSVECELVSVHFDLATRAPRVTHALRPTLLLDQGEKEKEGKGKGREGEEESIERGPKKTPPANAGAFIATYCRSWKDRYQARPEITGKEQGIAKRLTGSIGSERASELVESFLRMNDSWFLQKRHDLATFEQNLNAVVQFHETGNTISRTQINQADKLSHAQDQLRRIAEGKL